MLEDLKKLKIILSSYTPFHMYGLAKYLDDNNLLKILLTNYPYFKIKEYGINKSRVKCFVSTGVLLNIFRKTPFYNTKMTRKIFGQALNILFSKQISKYFQNFNKNDRFIFWGLSGYCLETLEKIKKKNCVTLVDFGSIHLEYQQKLMSTYNSEFKIDKTIVNPWMIQRQNEEFLKSDLTIVCSEFAKKSFKSMGYNTKKIYVKHPNLDLSIFKLKKNINKLDKYSFLFVGNLGFNKGVESLCRAFVQEFNCKNANLYIVGGNIDKKYTNLLKNKYSSENIFFLGTISKKNLVNYYNLADCTVLPSIADGFGKIVLESLSCGTPVICSKNVGALDILPKYLSDLSWEPFDIEKMKKSLDFMYKRKCYFRQHRSKLAYEFSLRNYNMKIKKEYELIFEKINYLSKVKNQD